MPGSNIRPLSSDLARLYEQHESVAQELAEKSRECRNVASEVEGLETAIKFLKPDRRRKNGRRW